DPAVHDQRGQRRAVAEDQGHHWVVDARVSRGVHAPQGQIGELADLDGADLGLPAEHPGAAHGGQLEGGAHAHGGGAADGAGVEQGLAGFVEHGAGFAAGGAVDPQTDGDTCAQQIGDAGDARAEAAVGGGAVGDPGAGAGQGGDGRVVEVDGVGEPDVGADPAESVQVFGGGGAETLAAVVEFVGGLGEVGVQAHAFGPGQGGGLAQQVGAHREG